MSNLRAGFYPEQPEFVAFDHTILLSRLNSGGAPPEFMPAIAYRGVDLPSNAGSEMITARNTARELGITNILKTLHVYDEGSHGLRDVPSIDGRKWDMVLLAPHPDGAEHTRTIVGMLGAYFYREQAIYELNRQSGIKHISRLWPELCRVTCEQLPAPGLEKNRQSDDAELEEAMRIIEARNQPKIMGAHLK